MRSPLCRERKRSRRTLLCFWSHDMGVMDTGAVSDGRKTVSRSDIRSTIITSRNTFLQLLAWFAESKPNKSLRNEGLLADAYLDHDWSECGRAASRDELDQSSNK